MTGKRNDALFAEWLPQHARHYYARNELWRDEQERSLASPLAEKKAWADAVLRNAERPNWLDGDLSRVVPKKRARIIRERIAIRLAAEAYSRAWDEVVAAFDQGRPEPNSFADLVVEFERCNQFACTTAERPSGAGITVWECTYEGFHELEKRRDWSSSGSKAHREEGRRLDALIKAASVELMAQESALVGAGMRSELARRISQRPEFKDDHGEPVLGVDAIRKRLKKMTLPGTLK